MDAVLKLQKESLQPLASPEIGEVAQRSCDGEVPTPGGEGSP